MIPKTKIFGQNFAHLAVYDGLFWTMLGFKKVVSKLFQRFFWSCLIIVWALFLILKGLLLVLFSTPKVDK